MTCSQKQIIEVWKGIYEHFFLKTLIHKKIKVLGIQMSKVISYILCEVKLLMIASIVFIRTKIRYVLDFLYIYKYLNLRCYRFHSYRVILVGPTLLLPSHIFYCIKLHYIL